MVKIEYDEAQSLLWYKINNGWSSMGWDSEVLKTFLNDNHIEYDYKVLTTVGIKIEYDKFSSLQEYWFNDRYQNYKGLMFDRRDLNSKKEIADTICTAVETNTPLCVIYEDNYCQYPSDEEIDPMVSQDGLVHIIMVGKTTGEKTFPLALASKHSDGGGILSLYGIKEVILLKGI